MIPKKPIEAVAHSDGLGQPAPPVVSREIIEQQRACEWLASRISDRLSESSKIKKWSIEAEISATLTRLVVHYVLSAGKSREKAGAVEIDFGIGSPIDRESWFEEVAIRVARMVRSGESDLWIWSSLKYLRLLDEEGGTLFERGKPKEW